MKKKIKVCEFAYERVEINGFTGDVSFCCPAFTKIQSIGNIKNQSFQEIWNGEIAQKIRQSMIDGNFKYCYIDKCCSNEELLIEISPKITNKANWPKIVELAPSSICNARCIMCRDVYKLDPAEKEKGFYDKMLPKYLEILKYAKYMNLNQCGEALACPHCKKLIQETIKINPNIKIGILSNGKNCNLKTFNDYGILNNIYWVQCSIHATTKKTYDKIVKDSDFKIIKENLQWLSELKKARHIERITMNFVVMSYNFKEIPKFIKWAKKLDFECDFWEIRQHPGEVVSKMQEDKNFKKLAVFNKEHPKHNEFINILKHPALKEEHVHIDSFLLNLIK